MIVWRLSRFKYQNLSGAGGLKYAGRWNEAGLPIVYTSGSIALTVLERRVHTFEQPKDDVLLEIEAPDDGIERLPGLEEGWQENQLHTRQLGTEWLRSKRSLCLKVPSVIVPDYNYLLNPIHERMKLVKVVAVKPYTYDLRLFQT